MKIVAFLFVLITLSCSYQIKVKSGDQAFQSKQYANAINFYQLELNQVTDDKEKAFKAFRLGQSFKYLSDFQQSLTWFKKAYEWNYGLKALEEYALALKNNGEYEGAILAYQELMRELKGGNEYKKEIQLCKLNLEWLKQKGEYYYKLSNIAALNDKAGDYSAVLDYNKRIYFVSDRIAERKHENFKFAWTGRSYSDIYVFDNNKIELLPENINSTGNEGPFCFNSKGDKIYFTRCLSKEESEDYCQIYESNLVNGIWNDPEIIDFGLSTYNVFHPALSRSDSILVFSSNAADGIGQFDLYISYLGIDGWGTPENLGELINSPLDEKFPVWYRDTLFFSSTGLPGLGGLDVFKTYRLSNGIWVPPLNMKPDINSEGDDFGFFIDTNFVANDTIFQRALISSNRNQNRSDEIYSVELKSRNKIPTVPTPKKFKWEVQANIQFSSAESYKLQERFELDSIDLIEKVSKNSINTKTNSRIFLKLLPEESYTFLASKKNYLNNEFSFISPAQPELIADSLHIINLEIAMVPLRYNEEFIIQELYYDFDSWFIRSDAIPSLEKLKIVLITNPLIKIRLGSHTDCRGDNAYNLQLSEKRALSAKQWLIEQGINQDRLLHKGFGEEDPSRSCLCERCTEEEHQKNRRTTFTLIK